MKAGNWVYNTPNGLVGKLKMYKKQFSHLPSFAMLVWLSVVLVVATLGCSILSQSSNVAKIGKAGMWVGSYTASWYGELDGRFLCVELVPTSQALPNKTYQVDLYEKGSLRATYQISWNEAELNVQTPKNAAFPISKDEYDAYQAAQSPFAGNDQFASMRDDNGWWRDIFSVEVYE
jgi:hypothetical protein